MKLKISVEGQRKHGRGSFRDVTTFLQRCGITHCLRYVSHQESPVFLTSGSQRWVPEIDPSLLSHSVCRS